jgi:hypothetical protein
VLSVGRLSLRQSVRRLGYAVRLNRQPACHSYWGEPAAAVCRAQQCLSGPPSSPSMVISVQMWTAGGAPHAHNHAAALLPLTTLLTLPCHIALDAPTPALHACRRYLSCQRVRCWSSSRLWGAGSHVAPHTLFRRHTVVVAAATVSARQCVGE